MRKFRRKRCDFTRVTLTLDFTKKIALLHLQKQLTATYGARTHGSVFNVLFLIKIYKVNKTVTYHTVILEYFNIKVIRPSKIKSPLKRYNSLIR